MGIKLNKLAVAGLACSAIFAGFSTPVFADTSSVIDKLYELGVLNDEDYAELNKEAKDERREAAEKSAKDNDPSKVSCKYSDGFKCKSKDGAFGLQLAGRIQQDYRDYDTTQSSEFDIRRLYFGVKGHVYNDWKFESTFNLDKTSSTTNDAIEYMFLEYAGNPNAKVRIGSQKIFYSFEEITSSRFTDFAERSVINSNVIGKDRGIQVHGEPMKNQFQYSVAFFNGSGRGDEDSTGGNGKGYVGRLAYNATGDAGKKSGSVFHFDVAYAHNNASAGDNKDVSGEAKSDTKIWTTTNTSRAHQETYKNLGFVAIKGPFKAQTEHNVYTIDTGSAAYDVTTEYFAVNWLLTGERYADNYSLGGMKAIKPNSVFSSGGGTGAWELGYRTSRVDADSNYGSGSNKAKSETVGLKWIPNHKTRFILNYVKTSYDTAISSRTEEDAWILRTQVDF